MSHRSKYDATASLMGVIIAYAHSTHSIELSCYRVCASLHPLDTPRREQRIVFTND